MKRYHETMERLWLWLADQMPSYSRAQRFCIHRSADHWRATLPPETVSTPDPRSPF